MPADEQKPGKVSIARRRLTIDGNDCVLDGMQISKTEDIKDTIVAQDNQMFRVYAGKSQQGYIIQNPRKVNQDSLLIHKDKATNSLILGTFDGHGEHGHCVSGVGASECL